MMRRLFLCCANPAEYPQNAQNPAAFRLRGFGWRRRRDLKTSIELFFVQFRLYLPFILKNQNKYNHLVHMDSVVQFVQGVC